MVQPNSIDAVKRFLITSQLVQLDDWNQVAEETGTEDIAGILNGLERRHVLTSLQRNRILKGDGESLLIGRYKLLYRNGAGAFARVFRASTLDGRLIVALKLLRERWSRDPLAVEGFLREARICQKFRHPNIVPIYSVENDGPHHFITMEFVEGGNLRDFVRIRQRVTPLEAAQCAYDICSGLSYANSLDTTHRDLKLTNVLMSSDGTARLVDFGLAGEETPTQSVISDDVHRALEYASLEKGTNAPRNDPRSDIFFAGAILYELLSSESPWPHTRSREERKQLSRYTQTRPLHTFRPDLPPVMMDITGRMMAINPNERYQAADDVLTDLRDALKSLGGWKGEREGAENNGQPPITVPESNMRLLVVDTLQKRIEAIRQYFEKHGFRLTVTSDPVNALEQLRSEQPPGSILFLADKTRDVTLQMFPQAQAWGRKLKTPCVAVFAADDEDYVRQVVTSTKFGTTMFQPATLRDIRMHFEEVAGLKIS